MKRWTTLLLLPLLAACSKAPEAATDPAAQTIEVAIGSGPRLDITTQSATRTTLDEEGTQVKWQTGDQLALWAVNSASQRVIEAATFRLYHYNASYNSASFRGSIPALDEDTYSYYAVSPVPAATDGLQASYDIPAVQDGTFHGEWDVMVAKPVTGEALREHDRKDANGISDNSDIVNLQFVHKIHVLKITLPKNDLGEPITEIELTFPTTVTGRLTVDASNPEADATLSGGSKTLTLRFAEPKDAGDVVYAMIAPVTLDEGQQISILAIGESSESESRTFAPASADRTFAAGHTTPINYNVPGLGRMFTRLNFRLDEAGANTLGEEIDTFTVTAPEGWVFEDGTRSRTFDVTGTGDYLIRFREYPNQTEALGGFQVTFDSENALITQEFTMPAVAVNGLTRINFSVPWLLYEDFSGVTTNSDYDNPAVGGMTIANGDGTAIDLTTWGVKTPGWTAARVGTEAGKAIRICARVENQSFASNTYNARLDSAPFSYLKEGKTPKVKVTFNYKGGRWSVERKLLGGDAGPGNGDAIYSCGYTTEQGWQPGSTAIPFLLRNNVVIPGTSGDDRNQNQNYDNISYEDSFVIPAAGNTTRASWMVSSTTDTAPAWGFNGNYWLYLDNIRVSIAQ
ncbi:fimbrillin family protein [Alistipes sp. An54]|uniref:fimbrillin family protein n=1 Tax=Alistipes sp. An54 TaxID=1965645 RepID=UPI001177FF01|nr:fimbrillin family protein [Alistipes sp. An54]